MIEEGSDAGEIGEAVFQIGDSVVAFAYPLTEGLIIAKAILEEGRLELSLIVAPYKKRGQAWSRATIVTRDAARLSKKIALKFSFPIKNVENLRTEAKRAKGDLVWAHAVCIALDKDFSGDTSVSGASDSDGGVVGNKKTKSSANSKVGGETGGENKKYDDLETRVGEVEHLNESMQKKETKKGVEYSDSDFEAWKKFRKENKKKKKKKIAKKQKKTASSDSSKSSSSSDSDSSRESGEVREKGKSGMFICPFDVSDARGFRDVKCQIKGQTVIRKHVRMALHNLYAENHTLTSFADSLVSKANGSAYKPFSTDTAWLQAHARNIDTILLGSLNGLWSMWNEQCLDDMMVGFLELVVKVSPHKEYPACLEDRVRKWMKKKRISTNSKYGPVSYVMQHAKFTNDGLQLFQSGWQKNKEKSFSKPATISNGQKGPPATSSSRDKKPASLPNQA